MDMPLCYITSFKIFRFPSPLKKNCNFLAQYITPRFLIFQVVLLFNLIHYSCDSISLYLIVFLETMQELMKILLVS